MNRIGTTLLVLMLCAIVAAPALASNPVRISQVYGGGGGSTGTYIKDFVELFNSSGVPVNVGGWYVEYGSAAGNWGSSTTNYLQLPAGTTIPACGYFLIECGAAGTAGVALPVTADISTTNMSMSATNGKVALFNALNSNLACGSEIAGTLVDKVSWGSANCPEVAAMVALTSTSVGVRLQGGMQDTDNNSLDFTNAGTGVFPLHNTQSPSNPDCQVVAAVKNSWGSVKSYYR